MLGFGIRRRYMEHTLPSTAAAGSSALCLAVCNLRGGEEFFFLFKITFKKIMNLITSQCKDLFSKVSE